MSLPKTPVETWSETLQGKALAGSSSVRKFNDKLYYVLKRADFPSSGKSVSQFVAIDEQINVVAVEHSVTVTPSGIASSVQVLPLDLSVAGLTEASLQTLVREIIEDKHHEGGE